MALIDLTKKVQIVLEKRGVANVKARVGFAIDVSGSMQDEFQSGLMEEIAQRVFALAARFDDDGAMDSWAYDNTVTELATATVSNIDGYMRRQIMEARIIKWHGTSFAPPLEAAINKWFPAAREAVVAESGGFFGFGKKTVVQDAGVSVAESAALATQPSVLIFLTDGDANDTKLAETLIKRSQNKPLYINFLGVGTDTDFRWIRQMGDAYPNVGFFSVRNLRQIDDATLYEGLVSEELATWLKQVV